MSGFQINFTNVLLLGIQQSHHHWSCLWFHEQLKCIIYLWIIIQIYYISRITIPKLKSLFLCLYCVPLSLKSSLHRATLLDMWSRIGILSFPSIPYRMRRKKQFWRSLGRSVHADVALMWTLMYETYKTELLIIV